MTSKPTATPKTSDRGFTGFNPIASTYGGDVRVQESSAASEPMVWLFTRVPKNMNEPNGPKVEGALHLTLESAQELAVQLEWMIANHYQLKG